MKNSTSIVLFLIIAMLMSVAFAQAPNSRETTKCDAVAADLAKTLRQSLLNIPLESKVISKEFFQASLEWHLVETFHFGKDASGISISLVRLSESPVQCRFLRAQAWFE